MNNRKILWFFLLLIMAGFTAVNKDVSKVKVDFTEEIPEAALLNESYEVAHNNNLKLTYIPLGIMKTTWYGPGFHGNFTANGEVYDQEGITCAHKTLPFGTLLKVTNPGNNKSVIVRVNDRGPFGPTNDLDLSKGAARELDFVRQGVGMFEVEQIIMAEDAYLPPYQLY